MSGQDFSKLALGGTNGNVRVGRGPFAKAKKTVAIGSGTFKNKSNSKSVTNPTMDTCTALGTGAGTNDSSSSNITESYCTFLGADTSVNATTSIINSTAVGAYAQVTESNQIVLGGMDPAMTGSTYPVVSIPGNLSFGSLTTPFYQFITVPCYWNSTYGIDAGVTCASVLIPYVNSSYTIYTANELQFNSTLSGGNGGTGTPVSATQIVSVTFSGVSTQGIKPSQLQLMTGPSFTTSNTSVPTSTYISIQNLYSTNGGVYIYATNTGSGTNCESGSFLATIMYNTQPLTNVIY